MRDTYSYKGYQISAAPNQLIETGEWTIDILIMRDHGNEILSRQFCAGNSFEKHDEAVANCFDFGRQIIDGQYTNCTVGNL